MARVTSRPGNGRPPQFAFDQKIKHHVGIGTAAATYYDMDFRIHLGANRGFFLGLFAEFRMATNAKFTPDPTSFFGGGSSSDDEVVGELSEVLANSSPMARRLGGSLGFIF